jgi:hypothetical protein
LPPKYKFVRRNILLQQYTRIIKITHFKAASEQKQSNALRTDGVNLKKTGKNIF